MLHQQNRTWKTCYVYLYLLQKDTQTVAISVECLISCEKLEDIQTILQLSECLSATNICEQNTFSMGGFISLQHNSHSDKVSLN